MGQFNSSVWRVVPVFDALVDRDPTGRAWLQPLLALPARPTPRRAPADAGTAPITSIAYGPERPSRVPERGLPAPLALLHWLVDEVARTGAPHVPRENEAWGTVTQRGGRRTLVEGPHDEAVELRRTAHRWLDAGRRRGWHVFEGPSYPDVLIETPEVVVVVEGKFTEREPTTHTTWMVERHQMLRHLDAAVEYAEATAGPDEWGGDTSRRVYGCFIVEDDRAPGWADAAERTLDPRAVAASLPHRTEEERAAIADAFLGVTTWGAVCDAFALGRAILPPLPAR